MYVSDEMIDGMVAQYGMPSTIAFEFAVSDKEFQFIKSSQKAGRNHDVTLYIQKDDSLVLIAKHAYPKSLYRAPSGGLEPGESFHDGIAREMIEETGTTILLERFLLRTNVQFKHQDDKRTIAWRSFIFLARYESGDFNFTDHHEIREVYLAKWEEFDSFGGIMRASDSGGLHYRAALHEEVLRLLGK